MGFFKQLLIKNGFNGKLVERELKIKNQSTCRYCKSDNLNYSKLLGYGDKMGITYHYKIKCLDCGRKWFVKRNKSIYEEVKDKNWIKTKSYKRKFN